MGEGDALGRVDEGLGLEGLVTTADEQQRWLDAGGGEDVIGVARGGAVVGTDPGQVARSSRATLLWLARQGSAGRRTRSGSSNSGCSTMSSRRWGGSRRATSFAAFNLVSALGLSKSEPWGQTRVPDPQAKGRLEPGARRPSVGVIGG
jgi:hypothetical protein